MNAVKADTSEFQRLDGRSIPLSWEPLLHQTMSGIYQFLPDEDRRILHYFRSFMSGLGPPSNSKAISIKNMSGAYKDFPVSATLLSLKNTDQSDVLLRLSAIMVCAALDPEISIGDGRKQLFKFSEKIRGAIKDKDSPLKLELSGAKSISQMIQIMEEGLNQSKNNITPYFGRLWTTWLINVITKWMRSDTDYIRHGLKPPVLVPALDTPSLPIFVDDHVDPDDAIEVTSFYVDETPANVIELSARARYASAVTGLMNRTSEIDLYADPDKRLPESIIIGIVASAINSIKEALTPSSQINPEPYAALALLIATSLREIELTDLVWGCEENAAPLILDKVKPLMYRRICRPPNAVDPSKIPPNLLETTSEYITFPVPPDLYSLIREITRNGSLAENEKVFSLRNSAISAPYQLREIIKQLMPGVAVGAGRFRQVMASHLAQELGPEVPQIILSDTFSLSSAPAYYGAIPEDRIFQAIQKIQNRWFNTVLTTTPLKSRFIGSRLVLNSLGARMWPEAIRKKYDSVVRSKYCTDIEAWPVHRNRLAAALVSAVGHRPTDQIGLIVLNQVIPEYGLINLKDKQSDILRSTRIAATGKLWITDLRSYLDRLVRIANSKPDTPHGKLAISILGSELPLFSTLNEEYKIETFKVSSLCETMPNDLKSTSNFYRHRLNQFLQEKELDPEFRHAQLGWIVSPAHSFSEFAPYAPEDIGRIVGPYIDELMKTDGWYSCSKRIHRWHWQGIALQCNKDWDQVDRDHRADHQKNILTLKDKIRKDREEIAKLVMPRMMTAFSTYFPKLRISSDKVELLPASGYENVKHHEILSEHHGLICDRVRLDDDSPAGCLEAVVARDLLYQLIKKARNNGLVIGPLPSRIYLNAKNQPSPFPSEIGIAIRQAESLEQIILERAKLNHSNESGVLTVLSILAFSPYRNLTVAMAAVKGAIRAERSRNSDDIWRVPARIKNKEVQLVLSGLSTFILSKHENNFKTMAIPTVDKISRWLKTHCADIFGELSNDSQYIENAVSLLRMSGRLKLSGPERLFMLELEDLSTVPVQRSLAANDNWPVQTRYDDALIEGEDLIPTFDKDKNKIKVIEPEIVKTQLGYKRLTSLVNPKVIDSHTPSQTATQVKSESDGHYAWRTKLNKALEIFISEYGKQSNLGVLAESVRRRLLDGGDKKKRLAHQTLYKELTYFGSSLLNLLNNKSLLEMHAADIQSIYHVLLNGKAYSIRAHVLDNLRIFHHYLVRIHGVDSISFDSIAEFVGPRIISPDMGLLTQAEVNQTLLQLKNDLHSEQQSTDASPNLLRLCSLRIVIFHILEASGIRPGSAHGLTLGDLHLMGRGHDFIHVHSTGEYGQAKTQASIGFFPLEGPIWNENRDWIIAWLEQERALLSGLPWWKFPVFAESCGSKNRFSQAYLTQRFDELFKWVSNDKKARTYWLRKNSLTSKHRKAISGQIPMARDVYRAVVFSGQAGIAVAMTHYINEPSIVMQNSLRKAQKVQRKSILQVVDLTHATVDMAWSRARLKGCDSKSQAIFNRLGMPIACAPNEQLTTAPPLKRPKRLIPIHIHGYAKKLNKCSSRSEAILRSGLSDVQADHLDAAAKMLLTVRGKSPWPLPELKSRKFIMTPARQLAGTESLFKLLNKQPDEKLILLAEAWAVQSHIHKSYPSEVILVLDRQELQEAASWLLQHLPSLKVTLTDGLGMPVIKREQPKESKVLGHSTAFEWVLALFWINNRFIATS